MLLRVVLKSVIAIFLLTANLLAFADSEDFFIDQFSKLNTSNGYFYANDRLVYYSSATVIQNYGDEDENKTLSMSSLSRGDWILVNYSYSRETEKLTAVQIILLPSESTAIYLRQEL